MAGKSASLLTKTQRNRIRDDFVNLDEEQKHRDQQRIRDRVKSGLFDFQFLADYSDQQFAVMLDDISDDELRAALADTRIVIERLREQSGIERTELIEEARDHIQRDSKPGDDTKSLEQIELRTVAEIRQQMEDELAEQFEPGRWDKRANRLLNLGIGSFILAVLGNFLYFTTNDIVMKSILSTLNAGVIFLLFVSVGGWFLVNIAQSLKYNIIPNLEKLTTEPGKVKERIKEKTFKNPRETLRKSWEEL